ncbi:MAG: acyl-CoA reductase, partial [Myxococcota bacterium]|nr:acyl-CoA reductase [Myxococcota bacterium]
LGERLRTARQKLLDTTIEDLMDLIDRLSARWLDVDSPVRGETIPGIVATTGFSPEMVAHAIDLEHESSRTEHLERAVQQEIGNPLALDQLTVNPYLMGQTRVVGPEVVGAVFSANIPGLPHLEVMRAFLVKATCLGKVPTGEPVFLGAYARTLAEEAPELAGCLAVIGVDRDDTKARQAFIEVSDYLVAYGGQEAIDSWQADCPHSLRATWHGHRMGFAVVLRDTLTAEALTPLAEALAYDFSLFDQEACLAPTTLYVETGGDMSPEALADAIAQGMADQARRFPPRDLSMNERATLRHWLDDRKLDGASIAKAPKGLPWVVLIDPTPGLIPTPPG